MSLNSDNKPVPELEPTSISESVENENVGRESRDRTLKFAALRASGISNTAARRAGRMAREAIVSAASVVGEIGHETKDFVTDTVVGVTKGTGRVIIVSTPIITNSVIDAIKKARSTEAQAADIGREAVRDAIVSANEFGVDTTDAASAAIDGAVDAVAEIGGDLQDATRATIGGVVSGVSDAGGDVADATERAAFGIMSHDSIANTEIDEISHVADNLIDTAFSEAQNTEAQTYEVTTAAAAGAIHAAYNVGQTHGDVVKKSVIKRLAERGLNAGPRLERQFSQIAKQVADELPEHRVEWRGKAIVLAIRQLISQGGIDYAAALGFFTVLSLLPLLALVIMGLIAVGAVDGNIATLTNALDYFFPASYELIHTAVNNLIGGSLAFGLFATISLVLGANGLFMAANRAINRVFGLHTMRVVQVTVANVALITIVVILFLASVALTSVLQTLVTFSGEVFAVDGGFSVAVGLVLGTISATLPAVATAMFFAFVYFRLPNVQVQWKDATFGAMVAIVLFEIAKHAYFWFTNQTTTRTAIYGPIASVVVLMMWAYIAGIIFLYGAAVTKLAGELRPK